MRKRLFATAELLNAESLTPADYCVMALTGKKAFEHTENEDEMFEEIKEVF